MDTNTVKGVVMSWNIGNDFVRSHLAPSHKQKAVETLGNPVRPEPTIQKTLEKCGHHQSANPLNKLVELRGFEPLTP